MHFTVISKLSEIETIAYGSGIRERARLRRQYGFGRWRKRKANAIIRFDDGAVVHAELHWYEATGIGQREMKIKQVL